MISSTWSQLRALWTVPVTVVVSGAGDSGVVRAELPGESVNAATVVASAAMETGVARVATLFAVGSGHVGGVTVCVLAVRG